MPRFYVKRKVNNSECIRVVLGCVNSDRYIDRLNILKLELGRRILQSFFPNGVTTVLSLESHSMLYFLYILDMLRNMNNIFNYSRYYDFFENNWICTLF